MIPTTGEFAHQSIMASMMAVAIVLWPPPVLKHTTISKHTMQQDYIVKTRKTIINNF
jgi:hypothetical protein